MRVRVTRPERRTPKAYNIAYPLRAFPSWTPATGITVAFFSDHSLLACDVLCIVSEPGSTTRSPGPTITGK